MRLEDAVPEMVAAIDDELRATRSDLSSSFPVRTGRCVHSNDSGSLYSFEAEMKLPIPTESPLTLRIPDLDPIAGILVEASDFVILIQLKEFVGDEIDSADITSTPEFVLESLADLLTRPASGSAEPEGTGAESTRSVDPLIALATLGAHRPEETGVASARALRVAAELEPRPNEDQLRAVGRCLTRSFHIVWGPPGTGKTACLAACVRSLIEQGERVLVLAYANAAVDVATLRVADALAGTGLIEDGRLLRVGVPQVEALQEREDLLPEAIVRRFQPDLIAELRQLRLRRRELSSRLRSRPPASERSRLVATLEEARQRIAELEEALREAISMLIADARVLCTTLARLAIDNRISEFAPDAVIVDEASMANFPYVHAAALTAGTRLLIFGDLRQLPPIQLADSDLSRAWFGRDVFEIAGARRNIDENREEPRVTMLRTQYRMAPAICSAVSKFAYQGRLETPMNVARRVAPFADLEPAPGKAVALLDTHMLKPACSYEPKRGSWSRANPIHAAVAVAAAETALHAGFTDISIITPYRAQAQLIARLAHGHRANGALRIATVHRFQGGESDLAIVDLVDGDPMEGASRLTGSDVDLANRLLTVSLSRPRGKLLIVANRRFITEKHPGKSPAHKALWALAEFGDTFFLSSMETKALRPKAGSTWFDGWEAAQGALTTDLAAAPREIVANFPAGFTPSGALLAQLEKSISGSHHATIFAPMNVAQSLEQTSADLRLRTLAGGFSCFLDDEIAYFGGRDPAGLLVRVAGKVQALGVRSLYVGSALRLPSPSGSREGALDDLCGRCSDCGEARRPVRNKTGRWVLRCTNPKHPQHALEVTDIENLVDAIGTRCPACQRIPVVRDAPNGLFLVCPSRQNGCEGQPPRLGEIFHAK